MLWPVLKTNITTTSNKFPDKNQLILVSNLKTLYAYFIDIFSMNFKYLCETDMGFYIFVSCFLLQACFTS